MQKKKGISLIVLVITIIVMIILAAAIIVSLNNNNIIGKAKDAVDETNLKQVEELAQTLWADAYIDGARTQEALEKAVLEGLKDTDTSKYIITVTTSGVDVILKEGNLNEYGFYYDEIYVTGAGDIGYVFHKDGSVEGYQKNVSGNDKLFYAHSTIVTYSKGEIVMAGSPAEVSTNGLTVTPENSDISFKCTFGKVHGIYVGDTYSATTSDGKVSIILDLNSNGTITNADGTSNTGEVTLSNDSHYLTVYSNNFYVSLDGEQIYWKEMDLVLTRESKGSSESEPETELIKELVGAIITPVEGSSVEAIKAGNPMVGDTIEYNGYIYKYGQMSDNLGNWSNIDISQHGDGWGVKVQDTTLATYPDMESTIYSKPVKFLYYTFINCENMVTAPRLSDEAAHMAATFSNCSKLTITPIIPDSVTNMIFAFAYCTSLTTVQNIPSNVTVLCCTFQKCTKLTTIPELPNRLIDMDAAFDDCTLLTSVSTIPATVTNLNATFRNCTSLEGTITINATSVSDYSECFKGTSKSITLAKTSCPVLSEIAATATGGNVIVAE